MKKSTFFLFIILILELGAFSACKPPRQAQQISLTPKNTPKPTNTIQPTSTPAQSAPATPFACSKSTIPAKLLQQQIPSENNKLIAFTRNIYSNSYGGDELSEIYVVDFDGSSLLNISNHPASDENPIWSPDGKRIAFLSYRNSPEYFCFGPSSDCVPELFSVTPDGSGLRQITEGITYSPAWSPDGKQLAFIHYFKVDPSLSQGGGQNESMLSDIYLIDENGSNLHNLTNKPGIYDDVVWNPDGQRLAFIVWPTNSIGIINSDGTNLSNYSDIRAKEVSWMPDGSSLVFLGYDNDIYEIGTDFTQVNKLTSTPYIQKSLIKLSQDGKWLVYYMRDLEKLCGQIRALSMENLQDYFIYDEKDVERLTEASMPFSPSSLGITSIELTQDGTQLVFTQVVRFDGVIFEPERMFSININGTNLKQIKTSWDATSLSIQP